MEISLSTQKWGAFCQYLGGIGLKFTFINTHFGNFCKFFQHRTAPSFVNIQTYSDDINFKVPSIWPYILEQNLTLYSTQKWVHFVNIVRE